MVVPMKIYFVNLLEELIGYFNTALGDFHVSSAHRWLVYTTTFIMVGLCTFISLEVWEYSDPLLKITLTYKGMYAWHTSINFALCLAAVDLLAARLFRSWGGYERRSVGKVWILLFATYLVGFISQRTLVYKLVVLHSPEVLWVYEMDPLMRPGAISMFLFMLPFWVLMGYGIVRIMLSKQSQAQELIRVRIDTILEERQWQAEARSRASEQAAQARRDDDIIPLPPDAGVAPLHLDQVCHMTAEDHYLRIYYQSDDGLKNILIRMPLKTLSARLPSHRFVQIHRSHIVNLEQVAGLKRTGRNVRVATKHGDFELPVSRYRLPEILPELEKYLHPN